MAATEAKEGRNVICEIVIDSACGPPDCVNVSSNMPGMLTQVAGPYP